MLRRRVLVASAVLGGGALAAGLLVAGMAVLFVQLGWANREPAGDPEFGFNFACRQAEYLLLEDPAAGPAGYADRTRPGRAEWCAAQLGTLIAGLGAKHVRLSVEWAEVEPRPGEYDFRLLDAQLAVAEEHGARVVLTAGLKSQRHPEFFLPAWAMAWVQPGERAVITDHPELRAHALAMVAAVTRHAAASPAIEGWGAENEPYVNSARGEAWSGWTIGRDFVREAAAVIRANDPGGRPVAINHGQHFVFDRRWQWALEDADVLAASIYPFRNTVVLGRKRVQDVLQIGPLGPNYAHQAREARRLGKEYWITEMQAEPWTDGDARLISPENPSPNLSPEKFEKNIDYARRTGASRVYLWGAEWWLFQREWYGDSRYWEVAREAIGDGKGGAAAGIRNEE
ncbi:MAG: beta-galactosidase [Gemmataceae bacterium]|nr:beta-galactosidase [Gemmataceae bacterium]